MNSTNSREIVWFMTGPLLILIKAATSDSHLMAIGWVCRLRTATHWYRRCHHAASRTK